MISKTLKKSATVVCEDNEESKAEVGTANMALHMSVPMCVCVCALRDGRKCEALARNVDQCLHHGNIHKSLALLILWDYKSVQRFIGLLVKFVFYITEESRCILTATNNQQSPAS